ncbi:VENN motif pre-toxin domain-containing protein, partial [Dickeya chrysanthemi]
GTDAVQGAQSAQVAVENNYLSVSEKSELEIAKQKLRDSKDPAEREQAEKDVARLTELDISRDKKVIAACGNGNAASAGCAAARLEAYQAKVEYENTGPYNSRASQQYGDAYGQIVNLLNITSVDAQNQQQVRDAMVNYAMKQLGVDKATAEQYISTYDGIKIIAASVSPIIIGEAAKTRLTDLVGKVNSSEVGQTSRIVKTYGPHEEGPLGNPNDLNSAASTFRSGTYAEKVAEEDMYLYRDYGGKARVNGRYWTLEPSKGPVQSQIDSAVLPEWGNSFENQAIMKIPKGTKFYEGPAAPQTGTKGTRPELIGGGTQVYLPSLKDEWIIKK